MRSVPCPTCTNLEGSEQGHVVTVGAGSKATSGHGSGSLLIWLSWQHNCTSTPQTLLTYSNFTCTMYRSSLS